jgi:hypothetical protein
MVDAAPCELEDCEEPRITHYHVKISDRMIYCERTQEQMDVVRPMIRKLLESEQ